MSDLDLAWGISRTALSPATYPDQYWADAYEMARAAADGGLILVPEEIERDANFVCYDSVADRTRFAAVVMHKGMLARLPLSLEDMMGVFAPIFENDVFIVLQSSERRVHLMQRWAHFASLHAQRTTRFGAFLHIPKSAGTAMVRFLDARLRSFKYFGRRDEFHADGSRDRYDFWAGHFYLQDVIDAGRTRGWISVALREPRARFVSAWLHARRERAPVDAMSPGMRAMRDIALEDFLQGPYAAAQINTASRTLGLPTSSAELDTAYIQRNAIDSIRRFSIDVFDAEAPNSWLRRVDPAFSGDLERANEGCGTLTEGERAFLDQHNERLFADERAFIAEALNLSAAIWRC